MLFFSNGELSGFSAKKAKTLASNHLAAGKTRNEYEQKRRKPYRDHYHIY